MAVSPGLVNTGIFASGQEPLSKALCRCAEKLLHTPADRAGHILCTVAAVQSAQEEGLNLPLYWHCGKPQQPSEAALHEDLAAALGRASERAVL